MKINNQNHEQVRSFLVLATFKEQADKLNLVELGNEFCIENEHYFYIFGKFKIRDFPRKCIKCSCGNPNIPGVDQRKLRRADILTFIYIYIYIFIYIYIYIYIYKYIYI